jgi:hypothetical protein
MLIRSRTAPRARVLPVIAAGAAVLALAGTVAAADLKVIPMKQAQLWQMPWLQAQQPAAPAKQPARRKAAQKTGPSTEVTGSISWPKSARATLSPATAGISYAHAAQAAFAKARAAMELGVMLLDDAPKNNTAALATATANVMSELEALEQLPQNRANEAVKRAMDLVQDWYRAGMRIINPPPQGLNDVPFPLTVSARAEAVAEALEQLVGQADAFATARLSGRPPATAPAR